MNIDNWKELRPFDKWVYSNIPTVFGNEMSYYEKLCKVIQLLNDTMHDVNLLHTEFITLNGLFEQLNNYVKDYFKNLDVQKEIDNKLDALVEDGTMDKIFTKFLMGISNVVLYGADNSGVNDSYNAFVRAIQANSIVFVPSGTYYISQPISLPPNIVIKGENKFTTRLRSEGTIFNVKADTGTIRGVTIKNLTLSGGNNSPLIDAANAFMLVVDNVAFSATDPGFGIKVRRTTECFVNTIKNCEFYNMFLDIQWTDSKITDCVIWNYELDYAINIKGSQTEFMNTQLIPGKIGGLQIGGGDLTSLRMSHVYFDGSYADVETGGAIVQTGSIIRGMKIVECVFYAMKQNTIQLSNYNDVTIEACEFINSNRKNLADFTDINFSNTIIGQVIIKNNTFNTAYSAKMLKGNASSIGIVRDNMCFSNYNIGTVGNLSIQNNLLQNKMFYNKAYAKMHPLTASLGTIWIKEESEGYYIKYTNTSLITVTAKGFICGLDTLQISKTIPINIPSALAGFYWEIDSSRRLNIVGNGDIPSGKLNDLIYIPKDSVELQNAQE